MRSQTKAKPKTGQRAKHRRYATRRRIPWIPIVIVAAVLGFGVLIFQSLEIGAPGAHRAVSGVGQHVTSGQPITYDSYPPLGGPHWPAPAPWGVSSGPIPDETAVHNLEHGGVVVSYNSIADADLAKLKALVTGYPRDRYGEVKLVVRPYDKVPSGTFALTAWGWIEPFTSYDEAKVRAFLDAHLNKCCESVP